MYCFHFIMFPCIPLKVKGNIKLKFLNTLIEGNEGVQFCKNKI